MNLFLATLILTFAGTAHPTLAQNPYTPVVESAIGHYESATCLVEMDGEVWAGTVGGGLINLDNSSAPPLDAATGLPGNRVNDCVLVGDMLWVATDSGLANLGTDQDRLEVYEYGRFLKVAAAGDILLAARDDGNLLELHAGSDPTGAARRQLDMTVLSLAGHEDGSYAAGSIDGKVLATTPDNPQGKTVRTGLPVVALAYDGDTLAVLVPGQLLRLEGGRLTPVANSSDVVSLSRAGEPLRAAQLASYQVAASLRINQTCYAATDRGVLRAIGSPTTPGRTTAVPPKRWYRLPPRGCPCGPRIASIASYNGDLWVGGFDSGLCRFDGQSWHHFRAPDELPSDMINHLAVGRHRLYVATLKGLVVIDERGHFTTHKRSQCVDDNSANCPWYESITGIGADSVSRNVWIADTGSVHRWSSRKWKHLYRKRGIISERITRIAADSGRIAVGTSDKGILWSDQTGDFVSMDDQQGLADNWVMDLTFDRSGALWVATCTKGLSRYHEGQWRTWSTADGLADDYTLSVADIDGRIWVGHFRGISILTATGTVHLGTEDGLPGGEVHDIVEHNGRVYLATDGGLAVVRVGGA
jgi:hypothetical protein